MRCRQLIAKKRPDETRLPIRYFWTKPIKGFHYKENLLERLDQTILGIIDNPEKTQQTTAIGTTLYQTLYIISIDSTAAIGIRVIRAGLPVSKWPISTLHTEALSVPKTDAVVNVVLSEVSGFRCQEQTGFCVQVSGFSF